MTALETNLLSLADASEDVLYKGLIYYGGFLYATNKKVCVRTRFDYPKNMEGKIFRKNGLDDADKMVLYKVKESVLQYEKGRGIENVNLSFLSKMLAFAEVYNKYAKEKLEYIRVNDALYSLSTLSYTSKWSEHFNLYSAATSQIKIARVLISRDSDTTILNAECRPEGADFSYIDYKDRSIVFGELNVPKLKAIISKKLEKAKTSDKGSGSKIKEYQKDLSVISEFVSIDR